MQKPKQFYSVRAVLWTGTLALVMAFALPVQAQFICGGNLDGNSLSAQSKGAI
jgi:hypothetical protein